MTEEGFILPYIIDFDGTICKEAWQKRGDKEIGEPIVAMVEAIREAANRGERIIVKTARHSEDEGIVAEWLANHNVPYEHIEFTKRVAKGYVDDKSLAPNSFIARFPKLAKTEKKVILLKQHGI